MQMKQEYVERLAKVDNEITQLTSQLGELKATKLTWLTAGKRVADMKPLNEQLRLGQQQLEDLAVTKAALEAKLRIYAQNHDKATELRDQANQAYDRGRAHIDALVELQTEAIPHVHGIQEESSAIGRLAQKHLELVGENMNEPHIEVPHQALAFAAEGVRGVSSGLGPIKPLPAWTYVSDEEHAAKRAAEHEARMKEHEKRIKIAEENAPPCPSCGAKMLVDRRNGHGDTPGESIYKGQWFFVCSRGHASLNAIIPQTK
jgi:hypothetical protein